MSKKPDDDLFKDSVMSFGEHLNELRGCLWRAILGLVVGVALGLFLADWVVQFIKSPVEHALQAYYLRDTEQKLRVINPDASGEELSLVLERKMIFDSVWVEPSELAQAIHRAYPEQAAGLNLPAEVITADDILNPKALAVRVRQSEGPGGRVWSLLKEDERQAVESLSEETTPKADNLNLLVGALNRVLSDPKLYDADSFSGISLSQHEREQLTNPEAASTEVTRHLNWTLLAAAFPGQVAAPHPLLEQIRMWKPVATDPRTRTKSLSGQEPFMIWLKAALIVGFVIASPWVFYQVWSFVAAGLYQHEKKFVHIYMPFSILLFLFGVFVSFFVFKPVLAFFFSFNRSLGIDPEPRISEWLSFVMMLPLGFGLAFQLPLVMLFLERIGVFTVQAYLRQWRVSVLVIWVIAALVTPADPYSIFFLAGPMMLLFFGGILLCKWWPSERNKKKV
jgi:sec-independent protein translocase protein TatC